MNKTGCIIIFINFAAGLGNAALAGWNISNKNYILASISIYLALISLGSGFKLFPTQVYK